jgi:hypothetical protein
VKKLDYDLQTHNLTPEQITLIHQIIDSVESSSQESSNPETSSNLKSFLDSLMNAVEEDSVFEFLIETFEKVKNFQRKNLAFYPYSFLNSLIIRYADPNAIYAAPRSIWKEKGYSIKPEYGNGIAIQKMGQKKDTTWDNANWFKDHNEEWMQYKNYAGLNNTLSVDKYLQDGGKSAAYSLASYGLKNNLIHSAFGSFIVSYTFTDNMILPIPGVEQIPLDSEEFQVKEDPIESMEMKNKVNALFDAVSVVAEKSQVSMLGIKKSNGDINYLNALLNKLFTNIMYSKYDYMLRDKANIHQNEDIIKGYAEAASHIVKKHYGLPTDSSKYNIASLGVDKSKLEQRASAILNTAETVIKNIDAELRTSGHVNETKDVDYINEVRKAIKKMLLEQYMK